MTTRRECIAVLIASLANAVAAQPVRSARIAILDDAPASVRAKSWAAFRARLGELGYVEGRNLTIDARSADGDVSRLDAIAAAIVASKPDVIVAVTTTVALAARKATSEIPIVALGPADPVKSGLVASLARPGGNLTGTSPNQAEVAGKWIDLVREVAPAARSVAYVTDRANPGELLVHEALRARARPYGLSVEALDGVTARQVDEAFDLMAARRVDALIVATTSSLLPHRARIVEGAARRRMPAIYARKEFAEAGGLMSFGTDFSPMFVRGADYVARILQGAKPAELPFEMASSFTLVLNMRTARALGIDIPPSVRIRADEVIE